MTRAALITGATGFIGGRLAERLSQQGWAVHAVVRPRPEGAAAITLPSNVRAHAYDGSMARLEAILSDVRPDLVFHLASLFLVDHAPAQAGELVRSNVLFPTMLVEAAIGAGCNRMINVGTAWQHYRSSDYEPVNLYAATKQAYQDILQFYASASGLSCITLKLFDTYGPGDPRRKLIPALVNFARSGGELSMSRGDQILDLCHVDDVIDAFVITADRLLEAAGPISESYLLGGERHTLKEVVAMVARACGRALDVSFGGRPYREREVMDPVRVVETLPAWVRSRDLEATLKSMIGAPE